MEIKLWRYNAHLHISHSLVVVSETGSNPNKLRVGPENDRNIFTQFKTVIFLWSPSSPDEVSALAQAAVVPLHRGLILLGEVLPGVGVGGHDSQAPQDFC